MEHGLIIKAISGFYYVKLDNGKLYSCRAKGGFRNLNMTPLVGDYVDFRIVSDESKEGYVEEIHQRKNRIIRPPMANIDRLIIISSVLNPVPDTVFIDKMLVICEFNNIEPIICFNKLDLPGELTFIKEYEKLGLQVIKTSAVNEIGTDELKLILKDGITAVAGFSGVGKSSLLNLIIKNAFSKTGAVSERLLRGKHTTTHIELFELKKDVYLADTPGFSNLDIDMIRKEELSDLFIEFRPYIDSCQYKDCSHTKEKSCAVINAVQKGEIPQFRHNNYISFYEKLKLIPEMGKKGITMIKIAPSLLSADFSDLKNELQTIKNADYLHLDVMDGHFVPNLSIGPGLIKCLRPHSDLVFDVHLMITNPLKYIESFAKAGADIITVHVECDDNINEALDLIKKNGKRCGVVLSPDTKADAVIPYLEEVDIILIMSVYPGFGGQKYIDSITEKIAQVKELIKDREIELEIDGGITKENVHKAISSGANVIVAGTSVFGECNRALAIEELRA